MKLVLVAYVVTLPIFVAIDFVWLSVMASTLYRPVMGDMLIEDFRLAPAVAFYLLYVVGLTFLAVKPGLERGSPRSAALHGAILGFTAYATYDLTNQATLRNWSTALTLADLGWGSIVSATAALIGCWISLRVYGRNSSAS
ncbi:DUF2177 family protein [Rhizobium sp. 16-449-1b]|uniref:DUF2177 family protein n=1 Tax=Rhizobium sp. 16-449-1b TaxID=2819989 RepID=UPI001ADA34D4|nr:DUF2177 family protein [Rhizobium sp. 16-449-1b]MBO9198396.1 DUF2177 family protein [Rhizobium sp. 16-449-1b]